MPWNPVTNAPAPRRGTLMTSSLLASLTLLLSLGGCAAEPAGLNEPATTLTKLPIVGGSETTIDRWPWQVSVQRSFGGHFCGGSIIAPTWILTAQHCVESGTSASAIRIEAGATRQSQSGQVRSVSRIVRFPSYRSPELGKDVALLELSSPLTLGRGVQPVPLASEAERDLFAAGMMAYVSGWGTLSEGGSSPDTLNAVAVPIVAKSEVDRRYGRTLSSDQIGAGYVGEGGRDSCQGDSGGPLVVPDARGDGFVLAGVVSWGFGCADPRYPGLYARVASFTEWIESYTGPLAEPVAPEPSEVLVADGSAVDAMAPAGSFLTTVYRVDVPANATALEISMDQLSGDPDLYVRQGAAPTRVASTSASDSDADCVPYLGPTRGAEVCRFELPELAAGTSYFIRVAGYGAQSSARLNVSVELAAAPAPEPTPEPEPEPEEPVAEPAPTPSPTPSPVDSPTDADGLLLPNNVRVSPLAASAGELLRFRVEVTSPTARAFTISTAGGSGDADLYVTKDAGWPDQVGYHCASRGGSTAESCTSSSTAALSGAGTYYILVSAYSAYANVALTVTYTE